MDSLLCQYLLILKLMRIVVAPYAGFCFGVERALKIVGNVVQRSKLPVYTWGPLIHNKMVVEKLQSEYEVIPIGEFDHPPGYLILRTHGVPPDVVDEAKRNKFIVVDATCPFVAKVHRYAKLLTDEGYTVVVAGDRLHPEVRATLGYVGAYAYVVGDREAASLLLECKKIGVVAQTTMLMDVYKEIISVLVTKCDELKIFNTICSATIRRQEAGIKVANDVDVMLVVGDRQSANTRQLTDIIKRVNPRTYQVEGPEEVDPSWFNNTNRVGVTGGASTPNWLIDKVIDKVKSFK